MKARLSSFILALVLLLALIQPLSAQTPTAGQANANANLRGGPGTTFPIVGRLTAGATVQIAACNDDCSWYQLVSGEWVAAFLVDATTAVQPATAATGVAPSLAPVAATTACSQANGAANLRSGPGTTYGVVGSASQGQCIVITGRNEAGDWYQLESGNWIAAFLIDNAAAISTIPVAGSAPAVAPAAATPITAAPTVAPQPTVAQMQPTAVPTAVPPTPVPAGPTCDPNYTGTCIPLVNYDLNCPDVGVKDFNSVGSDPHGFDRDKDGLACES